MLGDRFRQHGVTLIELVVVMVVLGILTALALPNFQTWIQNTQVRTAAESVQNGLQLARTEAVQRNALVAFQLNGAFGASDWRVCLWDVATADCSTLAGSIIQSRSANDGSSNVTIAAGTVLGAFATALTPPAGIPATVTFSGLGRTAAGANIPVNAVRVDLRNTDLPAADERRLVLTVATGGQIRMCDPSPDLLADSPQKC